LLTTYDESDDTVPYQHIRLGDIKKQAEHLNLDLITVPLPTDCPNNIYLERVKKTLEDEDNSIEHLIFGDWQLEDIRQWREKVFGDMGYKCLFPIWGKDIHELLPVLLLKPIEIKISAVKEEYQPLIKVGEMFDQAFVSQLSRLSDINPMGENGEFHTQVIFQDLKEKVK
jgi:diphthamide synthase (EF-2-diphthine--ammonia ligase)